MVGERKVVAVLCTHAHDDHVRFAPDLGRAVEAPVLLHPADLPVWRLTHADPPDGDWPTGSRSRSPTSPSRSSTPQARPGRGLLLLAAPGGFTGDRFLLGRACRRHIRGRRIAGLHVFTFNPIAETDWRADLTGHRLKRPPETRPSSPQ